MALVAHLIDTNAPTEYEQVFNILVQTLSKDSVELIITNTNAAVAEKIHNCTCLNTYASSVSLWNGWKLLNIQVQSWTLFLLLPSCGVHK